MHGFLVWCESSPGPAAQQHPVCSLFCLLLRHEQFLHWTPGEASTSSLQWLNSLYFIEHSERQLAYDR